LDVISKQGFSRARKGSCHDPRYVGTHDINFSSFRFQLWMRTTATTGMLQTLEKTMRLVISAVKQIRRSAQ
jgi:hypothetical protein